MKITTLKSTKIELSQEEEKTLTAAKDILEDIVQEALRLGAPARFNTSIGEELYTENFQEAIQLIYSILGVDLVAIMDDED